MCPAVDRHQSGRTKQEASQSLSREEDRGAHGSAIVRNQAVVVRYLRESLGVFLKRGSAEGGKRGVLSHSTHRGRCQGSTPAPKQVFPLLTVLPASTSGYSAVQMKGRLALTGTTCRDTTDQNSCEFVSGILAGFIQLWKKVVCGATVR